MQYTTRTRSTSDTQPTTCVRTRYSYEASWWQGWLVYQTPQVAPMYFCENGSWTGTKDTIRDNVNPGWRKAIKSGRIVLSNVERVRESRTYEPASLTVGGPIGLNYTITGDLGPLLNMFCQPPPVFSELEIDYHRNVALMKAYARMNAPDMVGGEYVKEFSSTVRMLRRPLNNSVQLIKKIYKERNKMLRNMPKTGANLARAASSAWLESSYGFRPIFLDLNKAIKDVAYFGVRQEDRIRVARGSSSDVKLHTESSHGHTSNYGYVIDAEQTSLDKVKASAGVMYRIKDANALENCQKYAGFRTRDIPATLWELTPYSFVVDWFSNVGSMIQALVPNPAVETLGHWSTTVRNIETKVTGTITANDTWYYPPALGTTGPGGSNTVKRFEYTRYCNQALNYTPLLPSISLSTIQAISGISLLTQGILRNLKGLKH